ncbi:MAG: aminoacyl-histidine dipeptidase [Kangiellaceae bacterium]|jgi:dipeptidase D|nr:aminoacyl-histidine dipeptidase [Kangiellaceae bacterium]
MSQIADLTPKPLWSIFSRLTESPRPSKHEERVLRSIEQLCDEHKLTHFRDLAGNLIIKKPATLGKEHCPGVVMQGHVDMVPQKANGSNHNFLTDPIDAFIDGDWVTARGTTLGSDNGIGVAAALAVLMADDIAHGPLEVLLTIDEETGMTGAKKLPADVLSGEILLNLDTEEEGELYVGCAGGVDVTASIPMTTIVMPAQHQVIEIHFSGFRGGHSGLDIDKGRGNANKLLNRFLLELMERYQFNLVDYQGGTLRNALARECKAKIAIDTNYLADVQDSLRQYQFVMAKEYGDVEQNITVSFKQVEWSGTAFDLASTAKVINVIASTMHGVTRMSQEFAGIVETSNNLAVVSTEHDQVIVKSLIRSLSNSARDDLARSIEAGFKLTGAETTISGDYPGWKPNPESKILQKMLKGYEELFNKPADIKVIHAGLECGLLGKPYPNWDMISFGPTIRHAHSPDEKVHIESVERFWLLLVHTLENIDVS